MCVPEAVSPGTGGAELGKGLSLELTAPAKPWGQQWGKLCPTPWGPVWPFFQFCCGGL